MISKISDSGRSYFVNCNKRQDTVLYNNIFLKKLAAPFSLLKAAEKNHISYRPLPVAVPAVVVPTAREHPILVRKQPVHFAP
jgi:hypothetical protein